jgi:GxxExxY protein
MDRAGLTGPTEQIIGCDFAFANTLGTGFLEQVYENALARKLTKGGLMVRQQIAIGVFDS